MKIGSTIIGQVRVDVYTVKELNGKPLVSSFLMKMNERALSFICIITQISYYFHTPFVSTFLYFYRIHAYRQ
jgi:hypothetical protein